jgi:hypothetical protein
MGRLTDNEKSVRITEHEACSPSLEKRDDLSETNGRPKNLKMMKPETFLLDAALM